MIETFFEAIGWLPSSMSREFVDVCYQNPGSCRISGKRSKSDPVACPEQPPDCFDELSYGRRCPGSHVHRTTKITLGHSPNCCRSVLDVQEIQYLFAGRARCRSIV